jgi:hypothetical protein
LAASTQEAARVLGARLRDLALAALLVGGALGGHEAEEGAELTGVGEAIELADLGAEADGGQGVDAAEAAQAGDRLCPRAFGGELLEGAIDGVAALLYGVDRRQVVGEGDLRGAIRELEASKPAAMRLGPVLAGAGEPKLAAAQEVREPLAGAVEIAAQVLAGAD